MDPAVTVLIPTFRRPRMLERAVRSALQQTYRKIVVRVIDNASKDETEEVLHRLQKDDERVVWSSNPSNVGAIGNFKIGLKSVATPFFTILADDDVMLPRALEMAVRGLNEHPSAMAWGGMVFAITEEGRVLTCRPGADWRAGFNGPTDACIRISRNSRPEIAGFVFRSEVAAECAQIEDDFLGCDVHWFLTAAKRGGIGITRAPAGFFVRHSGSCSFAAHAGALDRELQIHRRSAVTIIRGLRANCRLPPNTVGACEQNIKYWYGYDILFRLGITMALNRRVDLIEETISALEFNCGPVEANRLRFWAQHIQERGRVWQALGRWRWKASLGSYRLLHAREKISQAAYVVMHRRSLAEAYGKLDSRNMGSC